jgi:hypothetical protein
VIAARANLGNVYERGTFPGIVPGGVALYEIPRDADVLAFVLGEVHGFARKGEPGTRLLDEDVGSIRHIFRFFQPPIEFRHLATPFPGSVNLRRLYLRTLRLRHTSFRAAVLSKEEATVFEVKGKIVRRPPRSMVFEDRVEDEKQLAHDQATKATFLGLPAARSRS